PAPKPSTPRPERGHPPATTAPAYPAPQAERPNANPPQESSGFQMIPAPGSPPPNARPTYGQRPMPQQTPPPAQAYRPPVNAGRPAIIQTNPAPTQSQVANAGHGRFIWPVRGNVLSGYGLKANGQKNDGLNITVSTGEPVRAAAAGEVVYAGDQVPSFGNLVLIKHTGGWVTAYAHLGRIAVSNRDQVTQGQQIGVGGQTGAVDQPQLHFEVRYAPTVKDKAKPVDPNLVLPK
ncbi:MAG: peptidase, partial [Sphingomonas bacterium]|nr:peptidase [Sphingomonas bacterium]